MPGSLPAVADALTYQPPPSTSFADYSVAPTFVPASSSSDPNASDGSTTSNASLATQVYAAVTSPSTDGTPPTPATAYDDPALVGDPTFSTTTDPSADPSAGDGTGTTGSGQQGAPAAATAASASLTDASNANQRVAAAADTSAPYLSPKGISPLFQKTSVGTTTRGVDAKGNSFTTVSGETVQLTVASDTASDGSWSYTQSYVDAIDTAVTPDASGGLTQDDTVSAGYVYSAHGSAAGGFVSLTNFQNFDETGSLTQTVTASGMTSTGAWTWQQHQHASDTVWNSSNVSAGTTASGESGSVSASNSLTGIGTYFRPFNDGTANGISGSVFQTSSQSTSTDDSVTASQDSSGAVTLSGSVDDASGGLSLLTYGGSGTYTVSSNDGAGSTSKGGGTATESGGQGSSYGSFDHFTLGNDGSWQAGSGTGWTMAGGFGQQGYSGSGSFSSPLNGGGALTGTWNADANADTNFNAQTSATLNGDGTWTTTGTAGNGDDGYQDSSYGGSGSTGLNSASAPGMTGGGTVNASAGDHSNYVDSEHYMLGANGNWNASSGSGSGSSHGNTHSDYSGSGGYSYALTGGTMAGTWNQNGHDNTNYQTHTTTTLASDGVTWNTTGTGSNGGDGAAHSDYSGSGAVGVDPANSSSMTGGWTADESGSDDSSYGWGEQFSLGSGAWTGTSGSGSTDAHGNTHSDYSGSGGYTYGLLGGGTMAGSWNQNGHDNTHYQSHTDSTLGSDGVTWNTTGTGNNGGDGATHSDYSGSGSTPTTGGPGNGVTMTGSGTVNESGSDDSGYGYGEQFSLDSSGNWNGTGGSGSFSASGSSNWSDSGSGGYSRFQNGVPISGSWSQSDGANGSYSMNATSVFQNGTWVTTGTASSSGSGSSNYSYSGSGSMSQSSSSGDTANGADSSYNSQAYENYGQGSSYQYQVLSQLLADGTATTTTTASASGSDSGSHGLSSSGSSDSYTTTGDYAGGNGTHTESHNTFTRTSAESQQDQWQENYAITANPDGTTTTTGGSSGSGSAHGDASYQASGSGWTDTRANYGSGYSQDNGNSWYTSGSSNDHYSQQTNWSNTVGSGSGSGSGSGMAGPTNHIWGGSSSGGGGSSWSASSGSGSGSSSSSSWTYPTWTTSYDQMVYGSGFYGNGYDVGWGWGGGASGPSGAPAYTGMGYIFASTSAATNTGTTTNGTNAADASGGATSSGNANGTTTDGGGDTSGSTNAAATPVSASGVPASPSFLATMAMPGVAPVVPSATSIQGTTSVIRDASGRVTQVTDADGNQTTFAYDQAGRLASQMDEAGGLTTYSYDAQGNLASQTDPLGRRKDYTYDGTGRVLTETWTNADGTVADVYSYTYDAAGHLLTASNHKGTYTYTYNAAGQVATQTDPNGLTLTYGYDAAGNATSVADSLGGQTNSTYDGNGKLTSRTYAGPEVTSPVGVGLSYNAAGQLATITRSRGATTVGTTAYGYNANGDVTSILSQDGSGNVLASYQYNYGQGAAGAPSLGAIGTAVLSAAAVSDLLFSETDNGVTTNYGYDSQNQLTSAGATAESYDGDGNHTNAGYLTGTDNRLISDGTWNYTYDAAGNTVKKVNINTGETWTYGYDFNNRMTSAVDTSADGTVIQSVVYQYDAFGNRVEQDVTDNGATTVTHYAYDRGNAWAAFDGSGALQTRYMYLDGPDQPAAQVSASGGVGWYLTDYLGSVREVVNDQGTALDKIDYDAFGNVTNETNPSAAPRFGYAGGVRDTATGLDMFGWRYYDPAAGRWTTKDPSALRGGDANLYRYVGNDVTNATDPTGLVGYPVSKQWLAQDIKNKEKTNKQFWAVANLAATVVGDAMLPKGSNDADPSDQFLNLAMAILPAAENMEGDEWMLYEEQMMIAEEEAAAAANSPTQAQNLARQLTSEEQMGQALAGEGDAVIGAGTKKTLLDAPRLAQQYGGDASDWVKMAGKSSDIHGVQTPAGDNFEIHWYQNIKTGQVVELKTKIAGH